MEDINKLRLQHGTSLFSLPQIKQEGLRPRGKLRPGNYNHTVKSNPKTVYLTCAYAFAFAYQSLSERPGDCPVVLEVDPEAVKPQLIADEDAIEQANRGKDDLPPSLGLKRRTIYYRARAHLYSHEPSLRLLGTCGHMGPILPAAIKRVAIVPHDKAVELILVGGLDPQVSLVNYRIVGGKYRLFSEWLFDEKAEPWVFHNEIPEHIRKEAGIEIHPVSRDGIRIMSLAEAAELAELVMQESKDKALA